MPYKISSDCTKCGSCSEACPSEAISEGEETYVIDLDLCIDCGTCVDSCPASAIKEAE